jgi:soluble cytochrome b562
MLDKMKIKVPVKDLINEDIYTKVVKTLKDDSENAYTTGGIMVESFGVKAVEIHSKPFKDWKKGLPTMYGRIDRCLKLLVKEGKVKVIKNGKAWVYWWVGEPVLTNST